MKTRRTKAEKAQLAGAEHQILVKAGSMRAPFHMATERARKLGRVMQVVEVEGGEKLLCFLEPDTALPTTAAQVDEINAAVVNPQRG